jgi:septum formation protein
MLPSNIGQYDIILGSGSPRRKFLFEELGWKFRVETKNVEENFPEDLKGEEIPRYLCELKATAFSDELKENTLVITADTVVWIKDQVLNKPEDSEDAARMLRLLSDNWHEVITAVCILSKKKKRVFHVVTAVKFRAITEEEIEFYIRTCKPFDKAGSYGAQEWIGYVGVERIEGSYFNVMGLPVKELYEEIAKF